MNIIFMGTPDFAVESLMRLHDSGHNILAVVSQIDKPSGRGMKIKPTPVKQYALDNDIKVFQVEKIRKSKELVEEMRLMKPDVIVVVAYGQILPKSVIEIPKYGCINIHGSLLPKYRGAAPIQWAIINGEDETGITTMYMDEGMDTGDMIIKKEMPIEYEDNYGTLYNKLKRLGAIAIVETLEKIADGTAPREPQKGDYTLAPMIEKEICKIDWRMEATKIRNLIRGLNPLPGAYTTLEDKIIKIWSADVEEEFINDDNIIAGTIVNMDNKKGIYVKTGEGIINIKELQIQGSKRMKALEFLNGNKLKVGSILY